MFLSNSVDMMKNLPLDWYITILLGTSIAKKKEKLRAKKNQTCRNKCSIYIYDWLRDKLQTFFFFSFFWIIDLKLLHTMTTQQNWATLFNSLYSMWLTNFASFHYIFQYNPVLYTVVYKPYFRTWILLFGPFGQLRDEKKMYLSIS